jgi:hypothetical protein
MFNYSLCIHRKTAWALLCLIGTHGVADASTPPWEAVDAAVLDATRGGFTSSSGLDVSLGIERLVSINGQLVSRTSFQIADVRQSSPDQLRETSAALSAVRLIQNGSDNIAGTTFGPDVLGGTIIQNTLSNQQIESRTVINASVDSLGLLKAINFNASLGDAIARTAASR